MPKFLVYHTLPTGLSLEQIQQVAQATQAHPEVKGCQSFLNLTQGKGVCTWEGPDSDAVAIRLRQLEIPFDDILELEVEGERAVMQKV